MYAFMAHHSPFIISEFKADGHTHNAPSSSRFTLPCIKTAIWFACLQLMPETLFLTVNLIDRFLALKPVTRRNLQLVGCLNLGQRQCCFRVDCEYMLSFNSWTHTQQQQLLSAGQGTFPRGEHHPLMHPFTLDVVLAVAPDGQAPNFLTNKTSIMISIPWTSGATTHLASSCQSEAESKWQNPPDPRSDQI